MSRNAKGKREAGRSGFFSGYRDWVRGMSRGQKLGYRLLQVVIVLALCCGVGFAALNSWIRMPTIPGPATLDGSSSAEGPEGSGVPTANPEQISGSTSFENAENPQIAESGRRDGVYTFLVVGRDVASGSTDVMLLLNYDTQEKTVSGLSLPRDTMMDVGTSSKRLNAIFNNNKGKDKETQVEKGMAALEEAVEDITGVLPDYYVYIQWKAVGELVEAIGGVEFEVPFDMNYDDPYQDLHIHQKAGLRKLSGEDAMEVVRWRKNNDGSNSSGGDIARISIQQDFLKAVAKKCLTPALFLKLPELVEIFKENVETDLTAGNILALAQKAYGMDPDTGVSFETAPIGAMVMYGGASMVTLDPDGMLEIVNEKINPYLRDVKKSDLHMLIRSGSGYTVTSGKINSSIVGGRNSSVTPTNSGSATADRGTVGEASGTGSSGSRKPGSGSSTTKPSTGSTGSSTGSGGNSTRPSTGSTGSSTGSGGNSTRPSTGSTGSSTGSTGSSTGSGGNSTRPGTGSTGSSTGSGGNSTTGPGTGSTGTGSETENPGSEPSGSGNPGGTIEPPTGTDPEPSGGSGENGGSHEGSGGSGESGGSHEGAGGSGESGGSYEGAGGSGESGGSHEGAGGSGESGNEYEGAGGSGETPASLGEDQTAD